MLKFLPAPVLGVVSGLLFTINTLVFFTMMVPFFILKAIIFNETLRHYLTRVIMFLGAAWIDGNSVIQRLMVTIQWDVQGLENLNKTKSYLVISNHRSWTDIFVLQHIFNHRIPFLKFFLKKELIWVPLLGIAWWALDYPFMKRYNRQFLEKHPELRGKDMITTRKFCAKFKKSPVTVLNFLEGTRFTREKQDNQKSPFHHLLLPRAGGIAIVLGSMGEYLSQILDVTIVYPKNTPPLPFSNFLTGKIRTVAVRVKKIDVPEKFIGKNYETDEGFRRDFQEWINVLWKEKDQTIADVLKAYGADGR